MIKKIKSKLAPAYKNDNFYLFTFAVIIIAFSLIFTRLLVKTDDGNFLGMAANPDFTYYSFLKSRYLNCSGRTFGELLLMFFIRQDIFAWKISNSFMLIYLVWFLQKFASLFVTDDNKRLTYLLTSVSLFLIIITTLNPSAFWFSGSFTYLWPFCGMCMCLYPAVMFYFGKRSGAAAYVLSLFGALLCCGEEQGAACTVSFYIILLVALVVKFKKIPFKFIPQFVLSGVSAYFLLTSPGAAQRAVTEATKNFPDFASMGVLKKLLCGFSVLFGEVYFLSLFVTLFFAVFLSLAIYSLDKSERTKRFLIIANTIIGLNVILFNGIISILNRLPVYMMIRAFYLDGKFFPQFLILTLCGFVVMGIFILMLLRYIKSVGKRGILPLVIFAASLASSVVLGFSSSVFASGQRICFFTNMLMLADCIYFAGVCEKSRTYEKAVYSALIISCLCFALECIAYSAVEIPFMG